jgi:hypothetical protein
LFVACKPESARKADQAADIAKQARQEAVTGTNPAAPASPAMQARRAPPPGRLEQAEAHFEATKAARIHELRSRYAVIAAQPPEITTLATTFPLTDQGRAEVNEKLTALQRRLVETANLLDGLERTGVDAWTARDSELTRAMERLEDARSAAWRALDDAPKADPNAT